MYRTINSLLNKSSKTLPDSDSKHDLANKFLTFFIEKIENIRKDVSSKDASASASLSEYDTVSQCSLSDFQPLESEDIADIIDNFQANLVPWIQFHPGLSKGILTSCFPQSLRSLMLLFPPALSLLLLKSPSLHL